VQCFLLAQVLSIAKLPAGDYVKTLIEQKSPLSLTAIGIMKEHWSSFLGFGLFTCYALSRDHIAATEKRLKRSLTYERLYESSFDIQAQVFINQVLQRTGAYLLMTVVASYAGDCVSQDWPQMVLALITLII